MSLNTHLIKKELNMSTKLLSLTSSSSQEENLVSLLKINKKGVPATTSLIIAKTFEKNHDDVIKAIKKLIDTGKFGLGSFAESSYKNSQNKKQPMYVLDEKFTTILIMGFTGEKALDWKIQYQEEFQRLREAEISKVIRTKGDDLSLAHRMACQTLEHARKALNKETNFFHYANHSKLINEMADLSKDIKEPRKHLTKQKASNLTNAFLNINGAVLEGHVHKKEIGQFVEQKRFDTLAVFCPAPSI